MTASRAQLAAIRLLLLDVDGVLTDGRIHYGPDGELMKSFHTHDGLGLRLLRHAGVEVGVVTARRSAALSRRLSDLGIAHVFDGCESKGEAAREIKARLSLGTHEVAAMGDDFIDFPMFDEAGVIFAPKNAHPMALERAHVVTEREGGHGAVREAADRLLSSRGDVSFFVRDFLATIAR
ncbi:MAG: HAD hydrolase family protein [Myxococcales bacterium]|jgi:3-deoxy-D-manno-octulosonate 8-phosphate phosphatase (KDO 8-P phosphatase)|nr:HAD hydrolase family protein [Myxococcales bacterium]